MVLEVFLQRRNSSLVIEKRIERKLSNIALICIGSGLSLLFMRVSPMAVSYFTSTHKFGLLNYFELSFFARIFLSILILDFFIYFQHRVFHSISFLWRFHKVHHLDKFLDATTALRFHPIEIIISLFLKSFIVLIFGINGDSVLLFSFVLSSMAIFNHSNIQLPWRLEKYFSKVIVTPNFHVVHHHPESSLHHSNFGFNLSLWDYIFKTFSSVSREDYSDYECGINGEEENSLKGMLAIPFKD